MESIFFVKKNPWSHFLPKKTPWSHFFSSKKIMESIFPPQKKPMDRFSESGCVDLIFSWRPWLFSSQGPRWRRFSPLTSYLTLDGEWFPLPPPSIWPAHAIVFWFFFFSSSSAKWSEKCKVMMPPFYFPLFFRARHWIGGGGVGLTSIKRRSELVFRDMIQLWPSLINGA